MVWLVQGHLKQQGGQAAVAAGCRVEAYFRYAASVPSPAPEMVAVARHAPQDHDKPPEAGRAGHVSSAVDTQGAFTLELPALDHLSGERVRLLVSAPSGEILFEERRSKESLVDTLSIEISDVGRVVLGAPQAPKQLPQRRIQARVIDSHGHAVAAGREVLFFGTPVGAGRAGAEQPILATRTTRSGYLFGSIPGTPFEKVEAVVSGVKERVSVPLEAGFIAPKAVLVVEAPKEEPTDQDKKTDCGCGDASAPPWMASHEDMAAAPEVFSADLGVGGCVQFNRPNRALEEFDFYTVVRTTQPEINVVGAQKPPVPQPEPPTRENTPPQVGNLLSLAPGPSAASDFGIAGVGDLASDRTALVREQLAPGAAFLQRQLRLPGDAVVLRGLAFAYDFTKVTDFPVYEFRMRSRSGAQSSLPVDNAKPGATANERQLWTRVTGAIRLDEIAELQVVRRHQSFGPPGYGGSRPGLSSFVARIYVRLASSDTQPEDPRFVEMHFDLHVPSVLSADGVDGNYLRGEDLVRNDSLLLVSQLSGTAPSGNQGPAGATVPRPAPAPHAERYELRGGQPIDWDAKPTFYEATTIAQGHLLHFKQVWYADGYSLGDLLYSLPLAPGQKRMISVLDWERRESNARTEVTSFDESLAASLSRDRDLSEVVTGALSESMQGGSRSTMGGIGIGAGGAANGTQQGVNFGALLGISGGYSDSASEAWQDSAKNLSSSSLQQLRDKTMQSASAVRTLRSTVVQTASQGESLRATTEVVANHNHCHALTVQYFEVLRHLQVKHELADVQECLFVPLPMTEFDRPKALRWRMSLQRYLRRPDLNPAFDAARRVETAWADSDTPARRYGDEPVVSIAGELLMTVIIPMPPFPERPAPKPDQSAADVAAAVGAALDPTTSFLGAVLAVATAGLSSAVAQGARTLAESLYAEPSTDARFARFQREVMPGAASGFVDQLELHAATPQGLQRLQGIDFTLVSDYQPGVPLRVSVRGTLGGQLARSHINQIVIKSAKGLPQGCRAIVNAASLRYRSTSFEHGLAEDRRVDDDIDLPQFSISISGGLLPTITFTPTSQGTGATLFTPLDAWEQRNPRKEDARLAAELLEHLNDHLEHYHHALWWTMDPHRRYMLLDGVYAPNANGLSVASVVENQLIGIVGNSIVLPVARGRHIDPIFNKSGGTDQKEAVSLLDYYALDYPIPPTRISLPTRGVFAEAVMGACNACEPIDDSRFWRWEQSPIDEPPAIGTLSTDSRRSEPEDGKPTDFPNAIVAIQNTPAVPDPAGVKAALDALGKPSFTDITGLAGTQANAAVAYRQALETAALFGKEASALAQQAATQKSADKTLSTIDKAEAEGKISKEEAKELRLKTLQGMTGEAGKGDGDSAKAEAEAAAEVIKKLPPDRVIKVQTPGGTVIEAKPLEPTEPSSLSRTVSLTFFSEDAAVPGDPLFHVARLRVLLGASEQSTTTRAQSIEFSDVPRKAVKLTVHMETVHLDNVGSIRWPDVPDWAEPLRDQLNAAHDNFLGYTASVAPMLIPADGEQFNVKVQGTVAGRLAIQRMAELLGTTAEEEGRAEWQDLMQAGASVPSDLDEVARRLDEKLKATSQACLKSVTDLYSGRVPTIEIVAEIDFHDPPVAATIRVWPTAFGELKLVAKS